jgi:hypothetical protein
MRRTERGGSSQAVALSPKHTSPCLSLSLSLTNKAPVSPCLRAVKYPRLVPTSVQLAFGQTGCEGTRVARSLSVPVE